MRAITALLLVLGRCIDLALGLSLGISAILGLAIFGPIKYVALSIAAIFATVLIHESGHLLAGVALGWHLRRIGIGPFGMERGPQGFRFQRAVANNDPTQPRWGYVSAAPTSFEQFRLQCFIVTAGGPFASILASAAFTSLMLAFGTASVRSLWAVMVQWSAVGLVSLVPSKGRINVSDGLALWKLSLGGSAAAECQRGILCTVSHLAPLRPRDWPAELMCSIVDRPGLPVGSFDCYLAYVYQLDRDEIEIASRWLKRLLEQHEAADPPEYLLEAAYFSAAHLDDAATARKWLAREHRDAEPWVRKRAEAAIAFASAEFEEARELAARAVVRLRSARPCGAHDYELARLGTLEKRLLEIESRHQASADSRS